MNLISPEFIGFLLVCLMFWFIAYRFFSWEAQKWILCIFSFGFYFSNSIFYGILFIGFCVFVHLAAIQLASLEGNSRKSFFVVTLLVPLIGLFFFKYFKFSLDIFSSIAHLEIQSGRIRDIANSILLPIAVSFTVLISVGYLVDTYKKTYSPSINAVDTLLFLSFFGHLIAGPIVRGNELLPSFRERTIYNKSSLIETFRQGTILIAIGYFKKVCIADPIGSTQELIWITPDQYSSFSLWLALFAYAFQIYFDFSGYTDICRGCGKLFNIEIVQNFNRPYLSATPQEFWKRWHMSLSRWIKDYLYIPLGGGRVGPIRKSVNLVFVMTVCGLWHGASWNFIVWGFYQGLLLVLTPVLFPIEMLKTVGRYHWIRIFSTLITFILICIGWVFFRASSLSVATCYLSRLFISNNYFEGTTITALILCLTYGLLHLRIGGKCIRSILLNFKWRAVTGFVLAIIMFSIKEMFITGTPFIYFQF
ncbi:MAG: MBOAT family O-acyltransferase [Gammaproteobacteria bacterium]|nr:MBOAT family O-acyltransferase [Gammaproteobacteria bacterium]